MKIINYLNQIMEEYNKLKNQLKRKIGNLEIEIEKDNITISDKNLYKWIHIPYEDWKQVKDAIDELLNKNY